MTLMPEVTVKNKNSIIRMAKLHEAGAIALVHVRSWQMMYKEFIPEDILNNLSIDERVQQWHNLLAQDIHVLVLEVGNQIIGFASLCGFRYGCADNITGEISAIYVHPDFWRTGLGTRLCIAALAELRHLGYKKACLWVLEGNIQARQFYEALGFQATSSTKLEEFYENGALLREILYQKML